MPDQSSIDVVQRANEVLERSQFIAHLLSPQGLNYLRRLEKHRDALLSLPNPPMSYWEKVRRGWHEGWADGYIADYERHEPFAGL